jgi:parvulin-like peptidyl-prolyl isomerase
MKTLFLLVLFFITITSFNYIQRDKKQTKELAFEIYKRANSGENFEELAKKYSDDAGSNYKGGEYLNILKGSFVKEIENKVNTLKINEISKPFKTMFGYTIIKLKEKNKENYSINYILLCYKK